MPSGPPFQRFFTAGFFSWLKKLSAHHVTETHHTHNTTKKKLFKRYKIGVCQKRGIFFSTTVEKQKR